MIDLKEIAKVVLLAGGLLLGHAVQAESTVSPAVPYSERAKTAAIYGLGDSGPQGGKVYYVDDTGEHGLEAKAADEINSLSWSDAVIAAGAYGSGWHLPTKTELKVLYEHRNVVGGFAKDDYWSATEQDINSAWIQGFGNGDQDRYNKYSKLSVRAVRSF
jgi:hypothetical protein